MEKADALNDRATQGAASEVASNVRTDQSMAYAGAWTHGITVSEVATSQRLGNSARSGQPADVASAKPATSVASVASILKATFGGEVATALEAVGNAPEKAELPRKQSLCRWDVWGTPSDADNGSGCWAGSSCNLEEDGVIATGLRVCGLPWSWDKKDVFANN